jgi:type VI protein secretion system component Hcp
MDWENMTALLTRGWHRLAVVGVAAGATMGIVLVLGGAAAPRTAEAAQVPAAQAACPVQADPVPVTRTAGAFARIDGIAGDSADPKHTGEVDLTGVRAGLIGAGAALCGATGKVAFDPIVVEKKVDRASVPLAARAVTGADIKTVRITLSTGGAKPIAFLTYDLTDAHVVSIRQVKHASTLTEEVAFDFSRIAYTFVPQNANGSAGPSIRFCFDLLADKVC